jgi:DNA-binding LacI/PurR family transcriptional regulator
MGRAAVDALLSEILGTPVSRAEMLFHPELVVRNSTQAAALASAPVA